MSRRSHRFINSPMLHGINQKSYASMHRDLVIFPFLNHRRKNKEHGFFWPWMLTIVTPPNRYTLWHIDRYCWQVPMTIFSKSCWVGEFDQRRRDILDGPYHSVLGDRVVKLGKPYREVVVRKPWRSFWMCFWWNRFLLDKNSAPGNLYGLSIFGWDFFFLGGWCIFWKIGRGLFLVT